MAQFRLRCFSAVSEQTLTIRSLFFQNIHSRHRNAIPSAHDQVLEKHTVVAGRTQLSFPLAHDIDEANSDTTFRNKALRVMV
jgi:hypothetical protein